MHKKLDKEGYREMRVEHSLTFRANLNSAVPFELFNFSIKIAMSPQAENFGLKKSDRAAVAAPRHLSDAHSKIAQKDMWQVRLAQIAGEHIAVN